jgi:glycosyltransferase involved in cell wall biosynthesis
MRITIIHCSFIYTGGGERIILEQIKHLRTLGYDVECYAPIYDPSRCFPDIITDYGIKTFLPQLPSWFPLRHAITLLLTCLLIPFFFFKFFRTDVFLGENQPGAWLAFVLAKVLRTPYVVYLNHPNRILYPRDHEDWAAVKDFRFLSLIFSYIRPIVSYLDRISILSASTRLVNGFFIGREIERIYKCTWIGCPSGSPAIDDYLEKAVRRTHSLTVAAPLPLYPDTRRFSYHHEERSLRMRTDLYLTPFIGGRLNSHFSVTLSPLHKHSFVGPLRVQGFNLAEKYILYTGRHQPWKRIDWLIESFAHILHSTSERIFLVIRGPFTPHTLELRLLAQELGVLDRVVFMGESGQEDLFSLYKHAAVYAFPSEKEDFGIVIIEAMGQGLPVVAWSIGGPTDSVVDGETGYLVEPYNKELFAQRIVDILANPSVSEAMGRAGIDRVKKHFSWSRHIAVLEEQLFKAQG